MKDKIYRHICLNYHAYSVAANVMIALSMAGLALLGILTSTLTPIVLIAWGGVFAAIYGIGKLIDQEVDDLDKVAAHDNGRCKIECSSSSSGNDSGPKSTL